MNRLMAAQRVRTGSTLREEGGQILRRKCACGNHTVGGASCEACTRKQESAQRAAHHAAADNDAPLSVHQVLRAPGRPLDDATRLKLEANLAGDLVSVRVPSPSSFPVQSRLAVGRSDGIHERDAEAFAARIDTPRSFVTKTNRSVDLSGVRVHTDSAAAQSARAVGAKAYTVGPNIVFGAGQYEPHTSGGRRLLTHELAHVFQQTGANAGFQNAHGAVQRQQDAGLPGGVPQSARSSVPTHGTTPTAPASPPTYTFSVTLNDCEIAPYDRATVMAAAQTAFNTVLNSNCVHSASLKDEILNEFDGLNIDCEQKGDDCGMAHRYFTTTVNIYPKALDASRCGPLASTILHEVVHLTEWRLFGHGILADACEASCFGFGSGDPSKCR